MPGVTLRRGRGLFAVVAMSMLWAATAATPAPVRAWSNSGDGYGTHDWVVDQALAILDHTGRRPAWFDRDLALPHTDDPDTIEVAADPSRGIEHVYRPEGTRGGAIQRIAEHYSAAIDDLSAGDGEAATMEVALLSHFVADLAQPFHTSVDGIGKHDDHLAYELAVNALTRTAGASPAWSDATQSLVGVTNVRRTAAATAAYSRSRFAALYAAWTASGGRATDATVSSVTGLVLKRAARDLASIIWSIDQGVGRGPAVASLATRLKWIGVRNGDPFQAVYATAKDADGVGIEGLKIRIAWPSADGSVTAYRTWTDRTGYAKLTIATGTLPMLKRQDVVIRVTANGVETARTRWFIPSPTLASGRAGFKTAISDSTPDVGQTVKVTSLARDAHGRPVAGLLVSWTWKFGSRIVTTSAVTNPYGRAYSYRKISSSTTSGTVAISAHVQSHSLNRYSSTSFNRN